MATHSNNREMNIILSVQDDGSVSVKNFGENAEREFERTGVNWKKMGAAAVAGLAVIATATAAIVTRQANIADQAGKTAQKLGMTTESLTELRYAAELTGVAQNKLDMGLQRMTRRVAEAATGTGEAVKALDSLNLSAVDLAKLSPDEQFKAIADAMQNVDGQGEKVRLTFKLFDAEGVDLIRTMEGGSKGLNDMAAEAREFGRVITNEAAANAEDFNDNITRLTSLGTGLANSLMNELLPVLNDMAMWMLHVAKNSDFLETSVKVLSVAVKGLVTAGIILVEVFKSAGTSIYAVAKALVQVAQGEFSLAANTLTQAGNDVTNSWINAANAIDSVWEKGGELPPLAGGAGGQTDDAGGGNVGGTDAANAARAAEIVAEAEHYNALNEQRQEQYAVDEEQRLARFEAAELALLTDEERLALHYSTQAQIVAEGLEDQRITEEGARKQFVKLEANYQKDLSATRKRGMTELEKHNAASWDRQAITMIGMLADMTASASREMKELFYINKVASMANAIIFGWESVQKAYAFGSVWGPVGGAAMAAIAATATAANVYAISKTQFGGGSVPSAANIPSTPVRVTNPTPSAPALPPSPIDKSTSVTDTGFGSTANLPPSPFLEKQNAMPFIPRTVSIVIPDDIILDARGARQLIEIIAEQLPLMGSDVVLLSSAA